MDLQRASLDALHASVASSGSPPISFKYKDSDGDTCIICSDTTYNEAIAHTQERSVSSSEHVEVSFASDSRILRLTVVETPIPNDTVAAGELSFAAINSTI